MGNSVIGPGRMSGQDSIIFKPADLGPTPTPIHRKGSGRADRNIRQGRVSKNRSPPAVAFAVTAIIARIWPLPSSMPDACFTGKPISDYPHRHAAGLCGRDPLIPAPTCRRGTLMSEGRHFAAPRVEA